MIKLYAHPHDGVTDVYRDKEMTQFFTRDHKQYRANKVRFFYSQTYWVEIIPKKVSKINEVVKLRQRQKKICDWLDDKGFVPRMPLITKLIKQHWYEDCPDEDNINEIILQYQYYVS